MLFSQRKGIKLALKALQKEKMDSDLRNGLWNSFYLSIIGEERSDYIDTIRLNTLFRHYWHSFYKEPIDTLPQDIRQTISLIRKKFFDCPYNSIYDFLEFTFEYAPEEFLDDLVSFTNSVLERENAAYRFINGIIAEITDEEELNAVENALDLGDAFSGAREHLSTALKLLSDRKSPDFRNSTKESISAVESICQIISGDTKATLGDTLKLLEKYFNLHGALKSSFSNLYGYTSDKGGIRHAMIDEPNITFIDAKYMLVACSAFVNYLIGKIAEQNLSLPLKN